MTRKFKIDSEFILAIIMIFYGLVAAVTYSFVPSTRINNPITAMPFFTGLSVLIVFPFSKKSEIVRELSGYRIIRPILFSIGQILIVSVLANHSSLSTFVSTAVGTLVTTIFGKYLLKEKIALLGICGIVITLGGIFLLTTSFNLPLVAFIAGLIQASTVLLTRNRSLDGVDFLSMATASLFLLFCLSLPIAYYYNKNSLSIATFDLTSIIIVAIGFAILQSSYCYLSKRLEAWMLSLIGNSRIPASVLISSALGFEIFSWSRLVSSFIVMFGIIVAYVGLRRSAVN